MSLPLPTTTISVYRPQVDPDADGYDADIALPLLIATGVAAHFPAGSGTESTPPGTREVNTKRFIADPADIVHSDYLVDETTDAQWEVRFVESLPGPPGEGLEHMAGDVYRVSGLDLRP